MEKGNSSVLIVILCLYSPTLIFTLRVQLVVTGFCFFKFSLKLGNQN